MLMLMLMVIVVVVRSHALGRYCFLLHQLASRSALALHQPEENRWEPPTPDPVAAALGADARGEVPAPRVSVAVTGPERSRLTVPDAAPSDGAPPGASAEPREAAFSVSAMLLAVPRAYAVEPTPKRAKVDGVERSVLFYQSLAPPATRRHP